MAPGLACMNAFKLFVRDVFTDPSALRTSTGYRGGAVRLAVPKQLAGADPSIKVLPGQQVVVVSSAIRRFACCQYPPPLAGQRVIPGPPSIPHRDGPETLRV